MRLRNRLDPAFAVVPLSALALAACGEAEKQEAEPAEPPPEISGPSPETFQAEFETSKGTFVVEVTRAWAPVGADHFYGLLRDGYYDGVRFFRVIDGFMAQFGMHGDPAVNAEWANAPIQDDPVAESNTRGMMTFAKKGTADSRTAQVFVNYVDNTHLDTLGFAPFGRVVSGMDVVDQLYAGYGDARDGGPQQSEIARRGNEYLEERFPELDYVITAKVRGTSN